MRKYPIDIRGFQTIREEGYVYIDKTAYVHKMASYGKYYFLSRPRRFGKSMMITTLHAYFEGRKELFEGLAIEKLEKDWKRYPVLRIDLSRGKYYQLDSVFSVFNLILEDYERVYGITPTRLDEYGSRFARIIQTAYEQTGEKVVVLIDEYDAPMLDSIHKPELQEQIRERQRDLFSPLKSEEDHLRFVFLTGISKFSQLSIFSELNNLNVITFMPEYEAICGVTEEEMRTQLGKDIEELGQSMGLTFEEMMAKLKFMYDGYHFTEKMTDIYNPFSLNRCLYHKKVANYWFSTGTPTMLVNILREHHINLPDLEGFETDLYRFDAPTERLSDPISVLYQSGYLTLKGYDPMLDVFTLGFPNEEVRRGFADSLYKYYADSYVNGKDVIRQAYIRVWRGGPIEDFLQTLQVFYASMPYSITNKNERHYQSILYAVLIAIGADVRTEVETATGRLDLVLKMPQTIYIFELKYDKSAQEALDQIKQRDYAVAYANDERPKVAIGLNYNSGQRTVDQWLVEQL